MTPDIGRHTRPTGTFVTIKSRDDLDPSSGEITIEHSGRSVSAMPENVGLCEIIDVGPDVNNVKPGDICFIDFYDVAQGYLVAGQEVYVSQAMALRMTLDIVTEPIVNQGMVALHHKTKQAMQRVVSCDITPLPGYALTKHAPERMTVAVTGCDRLIMPRDKTTSGIVGGRSIDGDPCTFVVYEELVKFTPGAIQQERFAEDWRGNIHDTYFEERRLKTKIQRLEARLRELGGAADTNGAATEDVHTAAAAPADDFGVHLGDLVVFCTEFSIQFRALGELYRCVPYKNLLSVIDDAAILAAFNAKNPPPPRVVLMGGGTERLYGT